MRRQSIELQNADGTHRRWMCQAELDRMVAAGQAYRIANRKDSSKKYRMRSHPTPSNSEASRAALGERDTHFLASLPPGFIDRLSADKARGMSAARLQSLQRLMGHGIVPFNPAVADAIEQES